MNNVEPQNGLNLKNQKALEIILNGKPNLVGMDLAKNVIPYPNLV